MSAERPADPTTEAEAVRLLRIALAMVVQNARLPVRVALELEWTLDVTRPFDPNVRAREEQAK